MHSLQFAPIRSLLVAFALFAAPATAIDIDFVDILWVTDRVDGDPFPDPYVLEIEVRMFDDIGLARIEVEPPAGGVSSFDLVATGPLQYSLPPSHSGGYPSAAALFADFPVGSWSIHMRDGADQILDSYSASLGSPEVTDYISITNPAHQGTIPTDGSVNWLDCSSCDGTFMAVLAVENATDSDVDEFGTSDLSTTSWSPSGLVDGTEYRFETLLGNYSHLFTTETSSGGDPFGMVAGFESLDFVTATAVPEPSGLLGLLLGGGGVVLLSRRPAQAVAGRAPRAKAS